MIHCPYCLEAVKPTLETRDNKTVYVCPKCNSEIYRDFVEKAKIPRTTVGLVGFTGHGKTVYITSLFYLLKFFKRRMIWKENFGWLSLDDNTHRIMYKHVPLFEESHLPEGTPANFPHPSLIQFSKVPFFGDHFLSIYDTAGSVFEETARITDLGRFVAQSEVVLFVISIPDCGGRWADNMERLLETYINAVYNKLHVDLKQRQHLVVVLSKADVMSDLPDELGQFLQNGFYEWYMVSNPQDKKSQSESIEHKLRQVRKNSKAIREWLKTKDCGGFTNLAEGRFKSVEYALVSSTGAAPVGNQLATKLQPEDPKRVIDPLLLMLEKTRPKGIWERILGRFR